MSGAHEAEMGERLRDAAIRICEMVRRGSPGVSDRELLGVMAIATGMFICGAYFPATEDAVTRLAPQIGRLTAAGVQLDETARMKQEIESCEGAA
jgi:hypothetical protein